MQMGLGQCECAHPSVWAAAGLRTLCAGRFHSDFLDFLDFLDPDSDPDPDSDNDGTDRPLLPGGDA
ncbi:MAG TPA: hypothetical protein DEW46_13440 [Verrucomicrobia bacterium]|nr:hypothetical protein [Verrucomicrobiota bacterium]